MCLSHFDLMFQISFFTHPSTPETTHVYVDNSHVNLWSADAKTFVYNFFKVLRRDKKQSHQPAIVGQQNSKSMTFLLTFFNQSSSLTSFSKVFGVDGPYFTSTETVLPEKFTKCCQKKSSKLHPTLTFKSLSFMKLWLLKVWVLSKFDFWKSEFCQSLIFVPKFDKTQTFKSQNFDKTQTFKSQTLIKVRLLKVKLW